MDWKLTGMLSVTTMMAGCSVMGAAVTAPIIKRDSAEPHVVYFSPSSIKVAYRPADGDSEHKQQKEKAAQLIRDHCDGPYEVKQSMRHGGVVMKAKCI